MATSWHRRAGFARTRIAVRDANASVRLANLDKAVSFLPAGAHLPQCAVDLGLGKFGVWTGQDPCGFFFRQFQQVAVANQAGNLKAWQAGLARAKEFSGATWFQIEFGNLATIVGPH